MNKSTLTELQLQTITFLLQTNQKEQAISYYKEVTFAASFEAKDAIEEIEKTLNLSKTTPDTETQKEPEFDSFWQDIDPLILNEQLIFAIKNYRTKTNTSLKEAKEAVEERKRYLNIDNAVYQQTTINHSPIIRKFIYSLAIIIAVSFFLVPIKNYLTELLPPNKQNTFQEYQPQKSTPNFKYPLPSSKQQESSNTSHNLNELQKKLHEKALEMKNQPETELSPSSLRTRKY